MRQAISSLGSRRLICLLTALALLGASLVAQGASAAETGIGMVKDINPGAEPSYPGPWNFTTIGGTAYFEATDPAHGGELWKTDGTEAGTVMVKDINPGPAYSGPTERTAFGGDVYFFADDGTHGEELWKSDGTEAGTQIVKDINPGAGSAISFSDFTEVDGKLYFGANDGTHGDELWVTDGTEAGTHMVADVNPGAAGAEPYYLAGFDGEVFFAATTVGHGRELWKTDGTEAGTKMVSEIGPGVESSSPQYMMPFNGRLYFNAGSVNAFNGGHGQELWVTDGTEAGTHMVKDINAGTEFGGPASGDPVNFQAIGGTLYFDASDGTHGGELWKTDGTEAGTEMVKDIDPASTGREFVGPSDLIAFDGAIYFDADDGTHGAELWKTDGTEAGTELVKDIDPGAGDSYPGDLTILDGTLYFSADDGTHGDELWTTDGTEAGTVLDKDINPGAEGSNPRARFTVLGDAILFTADDGTHGEELWSTAASLTPPTDSGTGTTTEPTSTETSTQTQTQTSTTTQTSIPAITSQPTKPKSTGKKSRGKGSAEKRQKALKKCKKLNGKAKVRCVKKANQIGKHKKKGGGKKGRATA